MAPTPTPTTVNASGATAPMRPKKNDTTPMTNTTATTPARRAGWVPMVSRLAGPQAWLSRAVSRDSPVTQPSTSASSDFIESQLRRSASALNCAPYSGEFTCGIVKACMAPE